MCGVRHEIRRRERNFNHFGMVTLSENRRHPRRQGNGDHIVAVTVHKIGLVNILNPETASRSEKIEAC